MILIYSSPPLDKDRFNQQRNLLKERLSPFFINDDDFIYSSETNLQLLKELIRNHKIFLFCTESVENMGLSPSEIIELITYLLKNGCSFRAEMDNLSFGETDFDKVDDAINSFFGKETTLSIETTIGTVVTPITPTQFDNSDSDLHSPY